VGFSHFSCITQKGKEAATACASVLLTACKEGNHNFTVTFSFNVATSRWK
jgi:hypothetical protein